MGQSLVYEVREYADLAVRYNNDMQDFVASQVFVPDGRPTMKLKHRVDGEKDWFQRTAGLLGKNGYPEAVNRSDRQETITMSPRGLSRKISISDLRDPISYGYPTSEAWKQDEFEFLTHRTYINKECAAVDAIMTDSNYNSDQLYEIGGADPQDAILVSTVPWSDPLSNPPKDVAAIKGKNRWLTHMEINWAKYNELIVNPAILDYGTVTAEQRRRMKPAANIEFLESVFGLTIILSKAQAADDSTVGQSSQTLVDIFPSTSVWFGRVDPSSGGRQSRQTWGKEFYYNPPGVGNNGFITLESIDPKAYLLGELEMIMGYFNKYAVIGKAYGARLDNV